MTPEAPEHYLSISKKRAVEELAALALSPRCTVCGERLDYWEGRYRVLGTEVCSDCYFKQFGEEQVGHPGARGR